MLSGKRIAITREQPGELADRLREHGAIPIHLPLIQSVPILPNPVLEDALSRLPTFDWVIFTSANAVRFTVRREHLERWQRIKIAAVGTKTAEAVRSIGLKVDLVPVQQEAASLPALIPAGHILIPQAEQPAAALPIPHAEKIPVYRTVSNSPDSEQLAKFQNGVDALTFASPSAVHAFVAHFGVIESVKIVCIGKTTAQAATLAGLTVHAIAAQPSPEALIAALLTIL